MHPLFVAHLVADFLLQPTWLVVLKQKRWFGIGIHASIHALVMLLLTFPTTALLWAGIIIIALLHAVIDESKVVFQRDHSGFSLGFLVDQIAHFSVLLLVVLFVPYQSSFWAGEKGLLVGGLLLFMSFGWAVYNLLTNKEHPLTNARATVGRMLLVVVTFLLFIVPSLLLRP